MRTIIGITLCLVSLQVHGQSYVEDSVRFEQAYKAWQEVKSTREQAVQRIRELERLAESKDQPYYQARLHLTKTYHNAFFESKDSAVVHGREALRLFAMMGDRKQQAYMLSLLGVATWDNTETSLSYFLRALQIDQSLLDSASMVREMNNMSIQYHKVGKIDSAFYVATKCLDIGMGLEDDRQIAMAHSRLQFLHMTLGDHEQSIAHGLKGLEYAKSSRPIVTLGHIYKTLTSSFISLGKLEKALEYAREGVEISTRNGFGRTLPGAYRSLAKCYQKAGIADSADKYFQLALPEAIKAGEGEEALFILTALSELALARDDTEASMKYLVQAKSWSKNYGPISEPNLMEAFSEHFRATGQYDSAVLYGHRAFNLVQGKGLIGYAISASASLYHTYLAMNDFEHALKYYKISKTLTDSVAGEETQQRIAELQTKYDTQRKQEEITLLTSERRIQDLTLLQQAQLIALGRREAEKKKAEFELMAQQHVLAELTAKQMTSDVEKQKLLYQQMASVNELLTKDAALQKATLSRQRLLRNGALVSSAFLLIVGLLFFARYRSRRKYALALEEKNQLIEAEKQKAVQSEFYKSQFLANMSHEIRTPLHAITGMINVLNEKTPRDDQQAYLNVMRKSSESLMGVINNVLDISKIEAGKVVLETRRFSLAETLQNVTNLLHANAMSKNIALKSSWQGLPDYVMGDQVRLTQVLVNLVGNAIKFTESGYVAVEMKGIAGSNGDAGTIRLECTIEDTGIGIALDRQASIFQNFTQADQGTARKFGGTGLGLSISKQLIELQGGTISLRSEPGRGSTFQFTIPYQRSTPLETSTASEIPFVPEEHENLKILVVEDNAYNRIVAAETLEMLLMSVHIDMAENGIIALQMLEQDDYDLVFMDVQMPLLDGYQTTQRIRSELPKPQRDIPIIGVTANATPEDRAKCLRSGMNDYLTKPFYPLDLARVISAVRKTTATA